MRAVSLLLGLLAGVVLFPQRAVADVASRPTEGHPNALYLDLGVDGAPVTGRLGYARALGTGFVAPTWVFADAAIPLLRPDFGDFALRSGARVHLLRSGRFELPVQAAVLLRGTRNVSFSARGWGTELGVQPGWYAERWLLAAELSWDQQWLTYLEPTAEHRSRIYADARSGWYGGSAVTLRAGARVGLLSSERFELLLRAGYEWHGRYDAMLPPLYALVSANVRF
ncbi:hypothetical protein [Archangium lipolyticum]|uniref:hypothetical protein n=1 Tax=Archangium lipolyticum TaxID=2970465 RepID=UPI00214A5EC3|nr:hypothetical protein [Archangium lipolyticum]